MKNTAYKIIALLLTAALAGCSSTERELNTLSSGFPSSIIVSEPEVSSDDISYLASETSVEESSAPNESSAPQIGPHFSFPNEPPLVLPSGNTIQISSLSDALSKFSEIACRTPEGTPEQIVKTLLERNILVFASMQGKCWTTDDWSAEGAAPIYSEYITSVDQITDLVYGTYTENQSWRLFHPQEAGGYGDVFKYDDEGNLCFEMNHLRRYNGSSFENPTYAAVIESNDSEITFGRYYESKPSESSPQPNIMLFKAVKENGSWKLQTYITDAPAFEPPYSELISTGREGAPEFMEFVKRQVGNIGGEKYWRWYDFDYHVEWCAVFVSWCYAQAGKEEPNFTGCWSGVEWFREHDQWGDRDYPDIAPGDCIFFDWNEDGDADHVGFVIGTDGVYVYTVEGNRDDICITRSYPLTMDFILGYGLTTWNDENQLTADS